MSEQRQSFNRPIFAWSQPLTIHMINEMARPGPYLHSDVDMNKPVLTELEMPGLVVYEPASLRYEIGGLMTDNDKEETNAEEPEDKASTTLKKLIDIVLERYSDRKDWKEQSEMEHNSLVNYSHNVHAKHNSCINLIEQCGPEITNRQTLINENNGRITPAMMDNHQLWRDYISRVSEAQEHIPTGVNWLSLLVQDWKKRQGQFTNFWDMFEKEEPCKERDIHGCVYVIVLSLLPRYEFLQGKWDETRPEFDVFFENPPAWIEWENAP